MTGIIETAGRLLRIKYKLSYPVPTEAAESNRVGMGHKQSAAILPLRPNMRPGNSRGQWKKGADDDGGPPRILVIDDNATVLEIFRHILEGDTRTPYAELDLLEAAMFDTTMPLRAEQPSFAVDLVYDGKEGRDRARIAFEEGRPYAVAFVDMRMPGGWDGLKTIEELWRVDADLQIVICTAYSDHSWGDIGDRLGSTDRLLVLRKPFEKIEVLQMACALSHKWRMHREQQARFDELELRVQERTHHLQVALDERKAYEAQLRFQASHDALTGLPNRSLLDDRIAQAISQAHRANRQISVLFLDLDRFKFINDSFGHTVGDALLQAVGQKLQATVRATDTVARLGGDEFVIVLADLAKAEIAASVAQKVLSAFAQPFSVQGHTLHVTTSIGISVYPQDGDTSESVLKNADAAMYRAKEKGRDSFQFYTLEMGAKVQERVELENALRRALRRQEFELYYQPKAELTTGQIIGVEALIRWRRPDIGMVPPDRFIPLLEETKLIVPIGEWVLRTVCAQAKAWREARVRPVPISVNLSLAQLHQQDFCSIVGGALHEHDVPPRLLELEITETAAMQDPEPLTAKLHELKALGVSLAVDDFGTGYSSLSYLKRLPIDTVKIDRSFITDLAANPDDASIAQAIITMAHALNLKVVAEGVETASQLSFLYSHGCDQMQGYYLSRPLPEAEITQMLMENHQLQRPESDAEDGERALLLLDDEENVLSALKRLLRRDGYKLFTATNAQAAFELLANHKIGVIVSDQRMPGVTGVEFLRRVKKLYPSSIRMVLSGYTDLDSVTEAINQGAIYRFLTKPWEDNLLRAHIAEAFRRYTTAKESLRLQREADGKVAELTQANLNLQRLLEERGETPRESGRA